MKVGQLIDSLKRLDPEAEILGYWEDEHSRAPAAGFRAFRVDPPTIADAERIRLPDGSPTLKFGKSRRSVRHVLLNLANEF